jgi:hypothetical protein
MNERLKLASGKGGLNVHLWVFLPSWRRCVQPRAVTVLPKPQIIGGSESVRLFKVTVSVLVATELQSKAPAARLNAAPFRLAGRS